MNIDLTPEIKCDYYNNNISIEFSNDFKKIWDAEVDYIDYIIDCYREDPQHCRMFEFRDIYKFENEIEKIKNLFLYEYLNDSTIEQIKQHIIDLCNRFINSEEYKAKSIDYYKIWDNQKYY